MPTTEFVFDDRERELIEAFRQRSVNRTDITMTVRRLDMGDVLVQKQDGPPVVVERKHVADVMSSLYDGRLAEQWTRMRQWQSLQHPSAAWIVIVVEGVADPSSFPTATDPDAKYRHFLKTYLQMTLMAESAERHLVLRTSSQHETATLLLTLLKTINEGPQRLMQGNAVGDLPRKTRSHVFVRQLCCTQGVSQSRASRLLEKFASLKDLRAADMPLLC